MLTLLAVIACRAAPPPATPPSDPLPVQPAPAPARLGVEPRADYLANAPLHGLFLASYGLVNETYEIRVDFDTRTFTRQDRYAVDGHVVETKRTLTPDEAAALQAERDKVWGAWTAPAPSPSAEYQEHLYMLDGDATTHIRADNGFNNDDITAGLARHLEDLKAP